MRIILAGPRGKMGQEALNMLNEHPSFELVACLDRKHSGENILDLFPSLSLDAPIYTDPKVCLTEVKADVLLDLTVPQVGYKHASLALEHGIRPVIGTTGFTPEEIEELSQLASDKKIGAIIAPNFAIGAILMMKFSQVVAKYFPDVEIIEKHHDEKIDAPSGTAIKTAELIQKTREEKIQGHPEEREDIKGARGAEFDGMRIHSVRLPGLVAHQEVIFGNEGETLTIKHDSYNRRSFMSGVKLAIEQVSTLQHLVYGLENLPYFKE